MLPRRSSQEESPMRLAHSGIRIRTGIALAALSAAVFTLSAGPAHAQQGMSKDGTLVVPIHTSTGEDAGTASFKEAKDGKQLTITVRLKNIPFGEHAVHIHENPMWAAPDFKAAGGDFNPDGKQHGMD